ncbi:protein of unassigned function [Methylobacterium oryzae CBMB20]|uniref:Protein of unassigned function n=1 Tax=Methylobacterium oryzae CBMB20 TaxID=693986 RepID=A0A089NZ83_9HYPH|nr:protein of unassigned function [Methylobacterium oryzae CBMB20]
MSFRRRCGIDVVELLPIARMSALPASAQNVRQAYIDAG